MGEADNGERKETNPEKSYAIIMVKPHALDEVAEPVILDMFNGGMEKYLRDLKLSDKTRDVLMNTHVVTHFYRNLRDERYQPVLDIFYAKEKNTRQLPIILDQYTGDCMFMIVSSPQSEEELYEGLQELKGKETLLDENGGVVREGKGIRGVLIPPRQVLDLNHLSDDDIRRITRNVIHIADKPSETSAAVQMLLSPIELENLRVFHPQLVSSLPENE
jgi:hypothetical protein